MKKKSDIYLLLFVIFSLTNVFAEYFGPVWLIFMTKPALLTLLSLWFLVQAKANFTPYARLLLGGLIFSIFGDTFLMIKENGVGGELFFLLGLGSFLVTHLLYAKAFRHLGYEKTGLLTRRKILILPFLFFLIGNSLLLWKGIPGELKIPVLVYSSAITLMSLTCLNLQTKISPTAFKLLFCGVLLFVLSDTFIGINKFHTPLPQARVLIMLPYLTGQYLIAKGALHVILRRKTVTG